MALDLKSLKLYIEHVDLHRCVHLRVRIQDGSDYIHVQHIITDHMIAVINMETLLTQAATELAESIWRFYVARHPDVHWPSLSYLRPKSFGRVYS